MTDATVFPEGFLWGAAVSAYQVEGSPLADGAGPSIWHRFSHSPGRVASGENGDVACDFYRTFPEDVRRMRELGLNAFRFSISWSRVLPDGTGRVNAKGLDFYSRLLDALREAEIRPLVTLFHWDLPAALEDRGGWLNPDSEAWFADYARVVYRSLDDRVDLWATLNEPWVVVNGGYLHGVLAPGHRNLFEAPIASHHLLRAHAAAVRAYRAEGRHRIGVVVNLEPKAPASQNAADRAAAARAEAYMNRQYLDAIFFGNYPAELREIFGEAWPDFAGPDVEAIREPVDFVGVNYYTRTVNADDPASPPLRLRTIRQKGESYTETGWEVYPDGLTETLVAVRERYGNVPLYVTENGAAFYDPPRAPSETLEDPLRVEYLREHLLAAKAAIDRGVDLRGYFVWSLLDNFEWSLGYSKRFGIIHVNFETQRRTWKRSARFYSDVIRSRGAALFPAGAGVR